jgi:selenocysteine lyase/cysteine desulfurase
VRLLGGSATGLWLARSDHAWAKPGPLAETPAVPDERFWSSVREQFVMPPDLAVMNAANLCPSSAPVLESLEKATRELDREPSPAYRDEMHDAKEVTRKLLAEFLGVTPEEIVITRNTSESNNLVSNGLDLRAGDEVVLFADNHPSNNVAWKEKARRFGYEVKVVDAVSPHPGAEYYIEVFTKALTSRTKVLAFTHLTSTVGDLFPARELCRIARERGVLTLVDGAQSLGLLDVNLRKMDPDFFTGSAHKWPCGPKEAGVLFINRKSENRIWPSLYSAYPGAVGISKTFESFGQRDEPAIRAFGEALRFQVRIGRAVIDRRAQELGQAIIAGLRKIDGVKLWTHPDPARSHAVVSFQPGHLDADKLFHALYVKDRIVCAQRGGPDRGGLRFSPHLYNSHAEVERAVGAVKRQLTTGL